MVDGLGGLVNGDGVVVLDLRFRACGLDVGLRLCGGRGGIFWFVSRWLHRLAGDR